MGNPRKLTAMVMAAAFSAAGVAVAQPSQYPVASTNASVGYAVGGKVLSSGMVRFDGDTSWANIGNRNPRIEDFDGTASVFFKAGTDGVYRSLDGGQTWRNTIGWQYTEGKGVAIDRHKPGYVYASCAYGVFRSTDNGDSWDKMEEGIGTVFTEVIRIDRSQGGVVLAGTHHGIYRSDDAAATWTRVFPTDYDIYDLRQSEADPNIWLAGSDRHGIVMSTDGGRTWTTTNAAASGESIYGVALDPSDASRMAAAGWTTGIWISQDGGQNWTRHIQGLPDTPFYRATPKDAWVGEYPRVSGYALSFDPHVPGQLWVGTVESGVFRSTDYRNWTYAGLRGSLVFELHFPEGLK